MLTYRRRSALRLFTLLFALVAGLAIALGAMLSDARAQTAPPAPQYTFTKVAYSVEDGFDPFSFGCAAINTRGDIAFKAGRLAPDGFNTIHGIYRANADGTLTTIAEDPKRFQTIGFNPSINDLGQVSFAARLDGGKKDDTEAILRGEGKKLTTIASTADEFAFFGFDTSINNSGEVAFKAELDEEFGSVEGLFSGSGGKSGVTTHYLNSNDVSLDGEPARFGGDDSRPSINSTGDIAFLESIQPNFDRGIFVGREGEFTQLVPPDPDVSVQEPVLNDAGTVAFQRSFTDEATQEFVEQIVKIDPDGALTVIADTRDEFAFFGFRPPSINNDGEVAFHATLDDGTSGIFVGSDPISDRVIATGDTLDGSTVQSITFCEEGLSDSGELAFVATLEDPDAPEGFLMAVFRTTPVP
jgi:hypothetical protein